MSIEADEIIGLENSNEEQKHHLEVRDMVLRLQNNHDFRKLINEEYLVNEAASFVQLAGDPNLDKNQREDALSMAIATGHLKRWLHVRILMGNQAENIIIQNNKTIEELRAETASE